jgi:hypothetical protein
MARPRKRGRKPAADQEAPDRFSHYPIVLDERDGFHIPIKLTGAPGEESVWELWHWIQQRLRPPGARPPTVTASGAPAPPPAAPERVVRGPGTITKIAIAAGLKVLSNNPDEATLSSPFAFARAIAEAAMALGLTDADRPLNPASSAVRQAAGLLLDSRKLIAPNH